MNEHERVGCYLFRRGDDVRLFGSVYPQLAEDMDDATVTIASWRVAHDD